MKPWDITVTHIFWEQNRVADVLAKRALSYDRGLLIFHQPVPEVVLSLEEDVLGFPQGSFLSGPPSPETSSDLSPLIHHILVRSAAA
nr:putative ribonuclease H-like domain-containing protein [Ipomoea batatas]